MMTELSLALDWPNRELRPPLTTTICESLWLIRIKRIVAQKVEVYWRKLCCTNRLRRAPSVVALASTLSPCL